MFHRCCLSFHFLQNCSSICEGREFIDCPAWYKCPFENMLLRLRSKAEKLNVEPEPLLMLAQANVTLSSPASADTFVVCCFATRQLVWAYRHTDTHSHNLLPILSLQCRHKLLGELRSLWYPSSQQKFFDARELLHKRL